MASRLYQTSVMRKASRQKYGDEHDQLILQTRGSISVMICKHCQLPICEIVDGTIKIESKHGSKKHVNTLTSSHIKMVLVEIARQLRPEPEQW